MVTSPSFHLDTLLRRLWSSDEGGLLLIWEVIRILLGIIGGFIAVFLIVALTFILFLVLFHEILPLIARVVRNIWEEWTVPPWRLGWQTHKAGTSSYTPLLSETSGHAHDDKIYVNRLCDECVRVVLRSAIISGTPLPLTQKTEWHNWAVRIHGAELEDPCHMCRIIWFSIPAYRRDAMLASVARFSNSRETCSKIELHLSVTKEARPGWITTGRLFLQAFHYSNGKLKPLCERIPLIEENRPNASSNSFISNSTGSARCGEMARTWISNHQANHKVCKPLREREETQLYTPRRLLYIGDRLSSILRVFECTNEPSLSPHHSYTALSYSDNCNRTPNWPRATSENLAGWKDYVDMHTLPLVLQHAIMFTRRLGVNYIWIDALCVCEDDPNDVIQTSNEREKIYSNACCTLAASGAKTGDDGLFSDRSPKYLGFPCYLLTSRHKVMKMEIPQHAYSLNSFKQEVDQAPLSNEARGFVERLVSPRIVHFGKNFLFFECSTHIASELFLEGQFYRKSNSRLRMCLQRHRGEKMLETTPYSVYNPVSGYRASVKALQSKRSESVTLKQELVLHEKWMHLVTAFSRFDASSTEDRSSCISQLARYISGNVESLRYAHGIWERHFLLDLLWSIEGAGSTRPIQDRTPTWSWLSVNGGVTQHLEAATNNRFTCDILKMASLANAEAFKLGAEARPSSKNKTLALRCPVLIGTVHPQWPKYKVVMQNRWESNDARFEPDASDFDKTKEVFCAELVREIIYEDESRKVVAAIRSNGLVLHRTLERTSSGVDSLYQRIGRFRMDWPLTDDTEGKTWTGARMQTLFDRNKSQIVKID